MKNAAQTVQTQGKPAAFPIEMMASQFDTVTTTLLPEQFFGTAMESHARWTGERGLMLAVLQEAVLSYCKYRGSTTRRRQRLFAETQAWFGSRDQEYLYSFERVCSYLQLDPDYVRRGLREQFHTSQTTSRPTAAYRRAAAAHNNRTHLAQAA